MDFISKIQLPNGNDYLLKTETISTASGSIANFSTSLALPLVAMSAEITAQQAGRFRQFVGVLFHKEGQLYSIFWLND